jgi:hypothetical protein
MIRLSIEERLHLEKLLEQGVDLESSESKRVTWNLEGFREEANRVHSMVEERLEEAEELVRELHQELKAMPFLEAEQLQLDNLEKAAAPLEEIQVGLHGKLETGERELHVLQQQNHVLRATAQQLNATLSKGKGRYPFESPFYNAGSMVSMGTAKPLKK